MRKNFATWFLTFVAVAATVIYSILGLPLYVGRFVDDALYVCMSLSLLHGHYRAAFTPFFTPVTNHLPGYPLLLAPWVKVFGPFSPSLKLFSILMSVLSVVLLTILMKRSGFEKRTVLLSAVLLAFNPTFATYAGSVMPEPSFIFFSFLIFLLLDSTKIPVFCLGALTLGYASLVRPQGILLLLTIAAVYAVRREPRRALTFLLCGLVFPIVVATRNYLTAGTPTVYVNLIAASWSFLTKPVVYLERLKSNLGMMFPYVFLQLPPIENFILKKILGWGSVLSCLSLMILGFRRKPASLMLQAGTSYCFVSFLILPIWFGSDTRYFLVLLPFVIMGILAGIEELVVSRPSIKKIVLPLFSLLLVSYSAIDATAIKRMWPLRGTLNYGLPKETYNWMRQELSDRDVILSPQAAAIYLYTQRKGMVFFVHKDKEDFIRTLKEAGVMYVFINSAPSVQMASESTHVKTEKKIKTWINDTKSFNLVYENKIEGTKIFHLHS